MVSAKVRGNGNSSDDWFRLWAANAASIRNKEDRTDSQENESTNNAVMVLCRRLLDSRRTPPLRRRHSMRSSVIEGQESPLPTSSSLPEPTQSREKHISRWRRSVSDVTETCRQVSSSRDGHETLPGKYMEWNELLNMMDCQWHGK